MTRNEAKEILQAVKFLLPTEAYSDTAEEALDMAIEALERKHGIWMPIEKGDKGYSAGDFICSCCGKPNNCYTITDYCCSCGAKMERRTDE